MAHRHLARPARAALAAIFLVALIYGTKAPGHTAAHASMARLRPPPALAAGDADRDGIPDALEAALAARFAPIVVLDARDRTRPASIPWLLARFGSPAAARDGLPAALRPGSGDPRDWVTYVHVYPRSDGGINVQYWFFYAYNESLLFFDHDADWEHITVVVGSDGNPRGVAFAHHTNSTHGDLRPWSEIRAVGEHPVVLSALGTHASYPNQDAVGWLDRVSGCAQVEGCADPIWRTWQAGGLVNVGERDAIVGSAGVRAALAYAGRWGGQGHFPRSRPSPPGPLHQGGFVVDGLQND